jgi:hypothetical protein
MMHVLKLLHDLFVHDIELDKLEAESGLNLQKVRAWDFRKVMLVAPAMNTFMWDSRFTAKQLDTLDQLGVYIISPVSSIVAL